MINDTVRIWSRPFQALFSDSEYFLTTAQEYNKQLNNSKKNDAGLPNQNILRKERACARSCIVSVVAGVEALANCFLSEIKIWDKDNLDDCWLSNQLKKNNLDYWSLKDKVRYIPTLCNKKLLPPSDYFDTESDLFKKFIELIKIRNSIAHGRIEILYFSVDFSQNPVGIANDQYKENYWPETNFYKDIFAIKSKQAEIAYNIVFGICRELIGFLNGQITKDYLIGQKFKNREQKGIVRRESQDNTDPEWIRLLFDE